MVICTLSKDKSTKCVHHPLLALDIENNPKTGKFECAALIGKYKDKHGKQHDVEEYFDKQQELLDWIIMARTRAGKSNIPFWIVVFVGSYDHWFLENIIDDRTLFYANSRFITARIKHPYDTPKPKIDNKEQRFKGIKIIDLANHVDGSLESWIKYLDMENKYGIKKESLDNKKLRVMSDTRATYILACYLEDFYTSLGISMKLTVGSCALSLYKKRFFNGLYFERDSDFINDYERKALRGGRTELFKKGTQTVKSFDVNSTYLSIMRDCLMPDPISYKYYENPIHFNEHFNTDMLGIYHVKVKAPKQKIMCLPYYDDKTKKLLFPCGEFTGYWTSVELKIAKQYGYEIIKYYDYVIYKHSVYMFKEFADFIWKERLKYKAENNTGMDKLTKKTGNSLYGKFAQKNNDSGYTGKLKDYDKEMPSNVRPIISIIENVEYLSIPASKDSFQESNHSFPCISVFITSYARIKLFLEMKKHEENMVYCDTDSIKFNPDNIEQLHSKDLGMWGFEYEKTIDFHRPKWYGEKCKGVPSRATQYCSIIDRKVHAVYEKPNRFKESIRRNLQPDKWTEIDKILNDNDNKRLWIDNDSEPIHIIELNNN